MMSESTRLQVDPILAAALEALPDGFDICGPDGRNIFVTHVARERFPTFHAALDEGKSLREAMEASIRAIWRKGAPADIARLADELVAKFESGEPYEARTEDGKIVRVTFRSVPGGLKVASSVDITELRARERELKSAHEAAVAASAAKSAFLSNMSHEIRTPLNGILGMAQVLAQAPLSENLRDHVGVILEAGNQLHRLLSDVLEISSIEAGKFSIERRETDLVDLMRQVAKLWSSKAREAGLDFHLCIDGAAPRRLVFDGARVRQCLANLISNAIKFTREGNILVHVSASANGAGAWLVKVRVADSGIGVSEESLKSLFQPFSQAKETAAQGPGGTGLGLAITRRLAEMMGGATTVTSTVGKGSEFTFSFMAEDAPREGSRHPVHLARRTTDQDGAHGLAIV